MVTRLEQKEHTRRKLIDCALKLSAQNGFSAISLREVAKLAGIAPNGFYRHFRDMDELGLALVDEVGLSLRRLMREGRRHFDRQRGAVRNSVEVFLNFVTENVNLFRVLLGERQGSSSAFQKALHAEIDRFVGELTEDLERESTATEYPIAEPALAAEAIVAVVFTVGAEALDLPKHRRTELAERLIKEVKIILRGATSRNQGARKKR